MPFWVSDLAERRSRLKEPTKTARPSRTMVLACRDPLDEPPIRKLLRVGLQAEGYETIDAPSGKVGLERLAEKRTAAPGAAGDSRPVRATPASW